MAEMMLTRMRPVAELGDGNGTASGRFQSRFGSIGRRL